MCSEYEIRTNQKAIEEALGSALMNRGEVSEWSSRIRLSNQAPVIQMDSENHQPFVSNLIFPVQPFPNSRLSGSDEGTGQAPRKGSDEKQITRIYERPTWKNGFLKEPCLIPMSAFYEPVYWGEKKGSVMRFEGPHDLLFVAGIRIKPRVPSTGKINGFSLLTHTATEQMLQYHHRLLVFLKPKHGMRWIEGGWKDARESFNFLLKHRELPHLKLAPDRTMAKGWEKRVALHESKLNYEMQYEATLGQEGVEG